MMGFSKSGSLLALLWASSALATPLFIQSLFGRDTSTCPKQYTSKNGLNFTTITCNANNPFNDALAPFDADSLEDCMEHCSRFWGAGEGCFGVVWKEDKNCWMRNSTTSELTNNKTVYATSPEDETGTYSALVDRNMMKPLDTDCPAADLSRHKLDGAPGVEYTVQCNKDIGGDFDTCWQGYPSCQANPFQAFYHATSLEDCLGNCIKEHPLCRGVVYNPGLEIGYANCWPKTGFHGTVAQTGTNLKITHSATLTTITTPDTDCSNNETYTSTKDDSKNFAVHCGQTNQGTNMTTVHTTNFTSCMEQCAQNKNGCVGVVYDSGLSQGFDNCYLQNTSSVFTDIGSSMYAVLSGEKPKSSDSSNSSNNGTSGSNNGSNNNNGDDNKSSSKAWIAGAVIGVVAGLALIGAAIWFFRRRKNNAAPAAGNVHEADSGTDKLNPYHNSPAPAYAPVPQYGHQGVPRSELGGNEEHQMSEMEGAATAKYAHKGAGTGAPAQVHELQ